MAREAARGSVRSHGSPYEGEQDVLRLQVGGNFCEDIQGKQVGVPCPTPGVSLY